MSKVKKKEIIITRHSIILLIGPSNSGKTYFCKNKLMPFLNDLNLNCHYLSSDDTRRELMQMDLHKHDKQMDYVSIQAFQLLEKKIDVLSQFPVNADVIIVDATNLDEFGRKIYINIAKKNNYTLDTIVFAYKNFEDYFRYVDEGTLKSVIANHVNQFNKEVLKTITTDDFHKIFKITSHDEVIKFAFESNDNEICKFNSKNYFVIGDIHGCLDELLEIVQKNKTISLVDGLITPKVDDYIPFILVGDYIDKGPQIKETIEFLYNNSNFFTIVIGNHEYWVHDYVTNKMKDFSNFILILNEFINNLEDILNLNSSIIDFIPEENLELFHNFSHKVFRLINTLYYNLNTDRENILNFIDRTKEFYQDIIVIKNIKKEKREEKNVKTFFKFLTCIEKNINDIKNLLPAETDQMLIDTWFNTVDILRNDPELLRKFKYLFNTSFHAVETEDCIITHAPCENKYLLKTDRVSLRSQRNLRTIKAAEFDTKEKYIENRTNELSFLKTDASTIHKKHIFGHLETPIVFQFKNKIGIDTGCVSGGTLTMLEFSNNRISFIKVNSKQKREKEILPFFPTKKEINIDTLEREDKIRLKYAANDKLNFISGTMSPANKSEFELESMESGLAYFKSMGVKKVILQPKFMGSRLNMMLHKSDVTKCKGFSRNGYLLKQGWLRCEKTLEELYTELIIKHQHLFELYSCEYILFDGELLPWSAIGESLIEHEFRDVFNTINNELDVLIDLDIESKISTLIGNATDIEKKCLPDFLNNYTSIEIEKEKNEKFKTQLEIFVGLSELKYEAFSILKTIKEDGTEEIFVSDKHSNIDIYKEVSNNAYAIIDFENDTLEFFISKELDDKDNNVLPLELGIKNFWAFITQSCKMEGIVIKPEFTYVDRVAPFMKVRNPEYLRLVYGFNYDVDKRYKELIVNKSIKNKLNTSIKEWEIGKKMLEIPNNQISIENKEWVYLAYQLMNEQKNEKILDSRL